MPPRMDSGVGSSCPASTRGGGAGRSFGGGSGSSHVPISGRAKQLAYEPVCSHVADDFIFVGGLGVAHNQTTLKERAITHIVNCAGNSASNQFPDDFIYHTLLLHDHDSSDLTEQIQHTISFIGEWFVGKEVTSGSTPHTGCVHWCAPLVWPTGVAH
jgi:hypothetical protein